jgi:catechol 2,3-dioxygenase-like lactoylglutathione lyase family enzyme
MAVKAKKYNRTMEDLGNIVGLEHVNVVVPDQQLAIAFYITGLGLTRDPYMMAGTGNMWANVGQSQFHLPTRGTQVLRGVIGLVMPDIDKLASRLKSVREELAGTKFKFSVRKKAGYVDVTCPWGNRFRCHAADADTAPIQLGMSYVQFDVPKGTADGIARFYTEIMEASATVGRWENAKAARVGAGHKQELIFRESSSKPPEFDGHHLQIYIANFSGPYHKLLERGLIAQENNQHQYRFIDIFDPDTGKLLYKLDHEVRAMTHPMYGRIKVNRNPDQTNAHFAQGHESEPWLASATGS